MTATMPHPEAPAPAPGIDTEATLELDAQALAGLAQLDPTGANRLVERVLSTYLSSSAKLLDQLAQGLGAGDVHAMRLASHTLKSSAASIGALALSHRCAAVEQAVRDGKSEVLQTLIRQLQVEALRVDTAVRRLLPD